MALRETGALFPWGARYSIPLTRTDISVLGVERVPVIGRRRHLSLGVSAWERTPNGLWESGQCRQFERVCLCCALAMRAGTTTTTEFMMNQRTQLESAFRGARSCAPISIARTLPWTPGGASVSNPLFARGRGHWEDSILLNNRLQCRRRPQCPAGLDLVPGKDSGFVLTCM